MNFINVRAGWLLDITSDFSFCGFQMVVEEMNILSTVFLRYDNQKIIYPNSVLSTKPISNYYRSPDMGDAIDFCIHVSTPLEKIALMKERITRYVWAASSSFLCYTLALYNFCR